MADHTTSQTEASQMAASQMAGGGGEGQYRGGRGGNQREGGGREPGGFRIRLSDNEMRAARAVQEAFQLRSTVAALGFAIRTLGQMLEDGQLDELVAQHRAQGGPRGRRGEGGRGEGVRGEGGRGGERRQERGPRVDPFARPAKPAPAPAAVDAPASEGDTSPTEATAEQGSDTDEQGSGTEVQAADGASPDAAAPTADA